MLVSLGLADVIFSDCVTIGRDGYEAHQSQLRASRFIESIVCSGVSVVRSKPLVHWL